ESFKETENQPLVLRWAKALKRYAEKSTVVILDDELIVGRPNAGLGRWGMVYPELDGDVMPAGVEMFRQNKGKGGEVVVTDDDAHHQRRSDALLGWQGLFEQLRQQPSRGDPIPDPRARPEEHHYVHLRRPRDLADAPFAELDAGLHQNPDPRRQGH